MHELPRLSHQRRHARNLLAAAKGSRPTSALPVKADGLTDDFFNPVLADNAHTRAAYPAPAAIVRCIEAALSGSFAKGEALEARLFNDAAPPGKRVPCGRCSSPSAKPPGSRPGERCAGAQHRASRGHRSWHHGRRHRHEFRQRRLAPGAGGDDARGARPRHPPDPIELRGFRTQRKAERRATGTQTRAPVRELAVPGPGRL